VCHRDWAKHLTGLREHGRVGISTRELSAKGQEGGELVPAALGCVAASLLFCVHFLSCSEGPLGRYGPAQGLTALAGPLTLT
jgi:hypothetical protein